MDRQANIFFGSLVGVLLADRFIINKVLFDLPSAKYKSISKTDLSMSKMVIADHEDQDTITSLKDIYIKIRFKNQTKIKLNQTEINAESNPNQIKIQP